MRDVLAEYENRSPPFVVYVARVSRPIADELTWHDGLTLEAPPPGLRWLDRVQVEYHQREAPHLDADYHNDSGRLTRA